MTGDLCGTPVLDPGTVALTFDDGPGPWSADLAGMLLAERVPATFFVLGESIARHGDALDAYRDCGHVVGLHGARHHAFRSPDDAAASVARCAEMAGAEQDTAPWFRPPYGLGDWPLAGFAGPVGWHASGRDWDVTYRLGQTVRGVVESIAATIAERDGGIVLLHDYAPPSEFIAAGLTEADLDLRVIEITAMLVDRLRAEGFAFVTLRGTSHPAVTRSGSGAVSDALTSGNSVSEGGLELPRLRDERESSKAADMAPDLRSGPSGDPPEAT